MCTCPHLPDVLRSEDNLQELVFSTICVPGIEVSSPLPAKPSHAFPPPSRLWLLEFLVVDEPRRFVVKLSI